ncbi:pitrilysin family protein [Dysgonomonas sp. 520]|uniref:M16 family metallopeptidase n=1 Tax=Dysgonomonas sp. 520 TaxID=2302931 RepID=UPI0013D8C2B2|nr:pitrilysin family protein [Dysgonomonas sp. 520]NDW09945.1 insulinase family protein [Dysgonomonas sp. 520]
MKKSLYIFLVLLLSVSMQAQVDRSVQPKPGPAPKVNLGKPQSFKLPNGLTVLVVENHKLPQVNFNLYLDNGPTLEGNKKGVDDLASSLLGTGTSKLSKDQFNEKLDYYGASLFFSVHSTGGSTLSRYFPEVLNLIAQGVLDPVFRGDELESERAKLLDGIKVGEKSAQEIAGRVRKALVYGKGNPSGEFLREETINNISLSDIQEYYKTYFVPENAYLVIVGDVKFGDVKKLVTSNFSSWKKAASPKKAYPEPVNLTATEIDFVDVPHAVQSEISVSNVVNLKMTDPDYFAALLANQILGGGGEGRLFLNLREAHGWTYGSYSRLRGDKHTSDFTASASVRNAVTDSAVVEMLGEIKRIRIELPTQADLDLAKAKYVGSFVMNAEKPATIANLATYEKTQSLPATFYQDYIKNINAVTLEQVNAAAKKYFMYDALRIVVVGKAAEVLPSLEALNIPIKYYDKYADATEKPSVKDVDPNVTATSVLEKYIRNIGGLQAIDKVNTVAITYVAKVQGQEMKTVSKQTASGKSSQEVSMMGMVMARTVFDGEKGFMVVQGQKKEMTGDVLEALKSGGIIPETKMLKSGDVKIAGIEKVGDNDAYKIVDGKKTIFYDQATGLKVAEEATVDMEGQQITQRTLFGDYREVGGIKIPFKQTTNMMGMDIEMNVTDAKVNEGVSDADFK